MTEKKRKRKNHEYIMKIDKECETSETVAVKSRKDAKEMVDQSDSFVVLYTDENHNGCISMVEDPVRMLKIINRITKNLKKSVEDILDSDEGVDIKPKEDNGL